jgi:hypothetical protein
MDCFKFLVFKRIEIEGTAMSYKLVIKTKRFLRKPLVETFDGAWKSEEEVRRVVARFRPKAEILSIELKKEEKP